MRKVLLATTALVAMSVTAAQADISISGGIAFEVEDTGSTSYSSDGEVAIKSSNTLDNGLTVGAVYAMHTTSTVDHGCRWPQPVNRRLIHLSSW